MSVSSVASPGQSSSIPLQALLAHEARASGTSSAAGAPSAPPAGGGLVSAILDALSASGVIAAPTSNSTVAGTTASSSSSTASSGTASSSTAASSTQVAQALQDFLKSLVAALKSQSSTDTAQSAATSGSTAAGSTAAASTQSSLQTSFDTLMQDLGGNGGSASLASFLQAFSTNMQATSPLGNLVDSTA